MPASFGQQLERAFATYGQLCVGIDPHASLLDDWGLSDDVEGLNTFANKVLDACVETVGIIKPQVSFFERHGSAGFAVLERLAQRAAETDLIVIMDAKRGDIGSTMDGYFDAWLGKAAPFMCSALTVSPYLGFDSLRDVMSNSLERGKGLFVLAATSNPEGKSLQTASVAGGSTLAADIWRRLGKVNAVTSASGSSLGSFGAVVGATLDLRSFDLRLNDGDGQALTPILSPGFGAQGAELSDAKRLFGSSARQVIASVSRSVLSAGSNGISNAIQVSVQELKDALAVA
ncbi:MAG: orotidine-5'-phosphate decarboxylase [Actinomycetales bacterium]|nr:orotidine-5'-phosphate decarboxylase [Actinomycetales bacterium]